MRENEHTLFGIGAYGTNVWQIWSEGNIIHIFANATKFTEVIHRGKAGKSIGEQVALRVNARVRSKLDSGFKRSRDELNNGITNQIGLPAPMLASPFASTRGIKLQAAYIQPKLAGHRCLISNVGAYSRRGKIIDTIPEILESIKVPEGTVLDGELYHHGVPLQTIASWAKRRQKDTLRLKFHLYDIMIPDMPYSERLQVINSLDVDDRFVEKVETALYDEAVSPVSYIGHYKRLGYEGGILRPGAGLYEVGKRSKTLVKLKSRFDGEYECVDVIPSREGDLGICVLKAPTGATFKTIAPGDNYLKNYILQNKEKFIGRWLTVEYAELSLDKIPQHCVAIRWREDL